MRAQRSIKLKIVFVFSFDGIFVRLGAKKLHPSREDMKEWDMEELRDKEFANCPASISARQDKSFFREVPSSLLKSTLHRPPPNDHRITLLACRVNKLLTFT